MRIFLRHGQMTAIYDDALIPFIERISRRFGLQETLRRASHVEENPDRTVHPGRWMVDLTPSDGPVAFADEQGRPFNRREEALAFEKRWLEPRMRSAAHVGSVPQGGGDSGHHCRRSAD